MTRFEVGNRVQIDISDTDDPDFDRYHGRRGNVVEILEGDAAEETDDERDVVLFVVAFTEDDRGQFWGCDLRPAASK